jgi:hypothetical protein
MLELSLTDRLATLNILNLIFLQICGQYSNSPTTRIGYKVYPGKISLQTALAKKLATSLE